MVVLSENFGSLYNVAGQLKEASEQDFTQGLVSHFISNIFEPNPSGEERGVDLNWLHEASLIDPKSIPASLAELKSSKDQDPIYFSRDAAPDCGKFHFRNELDAFAKKASDLPFLKSGWVDKTLETITNTVRPRLEDFVTKFRKASENAQLALNAI